VADFFGLLAIILVTAIIVALVLHRLRQSVLIGYVLCGLLLGSGGLKIVNDPEQIHVVSEVGVVLLMFSLGIEFSIAELRHLSGIALRGGGTQMLLASAGLAGLLVVAGVPLKIAILTGLAGGMSSTAIVLRIFQEGEHAGGSASRLALGIAIFQDLAAVAIILLLPVFAGHGGTRELAAGLLTALVKCAAFAGMGWLLSRFVVPQLLGYVHRTRSRELFTLMVLALCAGIAYLGSLFGLSLALGAFVAGLIVSETIFSHKILADILPFKDFFLALFFIAVGIQVDLAYCMAHWPALLGATAFVLVWKTLAGTAGGLATGFPVRAAVTAGLGLGSIGEFSFVVAGSALAAGLLGADFHKAFLACGILTMAATPLMMKLAGPLGERLDGWKIFQHHPLFSARRAQKRPDDLKGHVIICGHGMIGETLNDTLAKIGVPTLVIELNADTVKRLLKQGQPCLFADISQAESMMLARLPDARVLVVTVPHFKSAMAAVKNALDLNPGIYVICRARYPRHAQPLRNLGVHVVINEEAETSFEVIRRTLLQFEQAPDDIAGVIRALRFEYGVED
jgi:monovalent cation:H+ antiporter-2, CPA2 family